LAGEQSRWEKNGSAQILRCAQDDKKQKLAFPTLL